ncbi:MAG: LysR family transcriptional regulator [Candidatus Desulfofervidus auxilii]|nr:LysR family transcriptional regulator [Candidatus Desulfofervidus auxilii]
MIYIHVKMWYRVPMYLDLFSAKVFITVVEEGSFSLASKKLFITQPAVSFQIKALEDMYNSTFIIRKQGGLKLTKAGETFYNFAKKFVKLNDELVNSIRIQHQREKKDLIIGASSTFGEYLLPKILIKFREAYPNIKTSFRIGKSPAILSGLANRDIDIGIVGNPLSTSVEYEEFLEDPLVMIVPKKYNYNDSPLKLKDVLEFPFIIREEESGVTWCWKHYLLKHKLSWNKVKIRAVVHCNACAKAAVKEGWGACVLSKIAISESSQHYNILDFEGRLKRYFYFAYLEEKVKDPRINLFRKFLKINFSHNSLPSQISS